MRFYSIMPHPERIRLSLRVQVPNNHTLAQNLYYDFYYAKHKYLIIGYLDRLGKYRILPVPLIELAFLRWFLIVSLVCRLGHNMVRVHKMGSNNNAISNLSAGTTKVQGSHRDWTTWRPNMQGWVLFGNSCLHAARAAPRNFSSTASWRLRLVS